MFKNKKIIQFLSCALLSAFLFTTLSAPYAKAAHDLPFPSRQRREESRGFNSSKGNVLDSSRLWRDGNDNHKKTFGCYKQQYLLNLEQLKIPDNEALTKQVNAIKDIIENRLLFAAPLERSGKRYVFGAYCGDQSRVHFVIEYVKRSDSMQNYSSASDSFRESIKSAVGTLRASPLCSLPEGQITGVVNALAQGIVGPNQEIRRVLTDQEINENTTGTFIKVEGESESTGLAKLKDVVPSSLMVEEHQDQITLQANQGFKEATESFQEQKQSHEEAPLIDEDKEAGKVPGLLELWEELLKISGMDKVAAWIETRAYFKVYGLLKLLKTYASLPTEEEIRELLRSSIEQIKKMLEGIGNIASKPPMQLISILNFQLGTADLPANTELDKIVTSALSRAFAKLHNNRAYNFGTGKFETANKDHENSLEKLGQNIVNGYEEGGMDKAFKVHDGENEAAKSAQMEKQLNLTNFNGGKNESNNNNNNNNSVEINQEDQEVENFLVKYPKTGKAFGKEFIKAHFDDFKKLKQSSGKNAEKFFNFHLPKLEKIFKKERKDFDYFWPGLVELCIAIIAIKGSGYYCEKLAESLVEFKEGFEQDFKSYWPGFVRLCIAAGEKQLGVIGFTLAELREDFSPDDFKHLWPGFVNLGVNVRKNLISLFRSSIPALKHLILDQESLQEVSSILVSLNHILGKNAYIFFEYAAPIVEDIIKNNMNFENFGKQLLVLIEGSKENVTDLFKGMTVLKETFKEEFKTYWPFFVRLGIDAGANAGYLFKYVLPAVEGLIKNCEDLERLQEVLVTLSQRLLRNDAYKALLPLESLITNINEADPKNPYSTVRQLITVFEIHGLETEKVSKALHEIKELIRTYPASWELLLYPVLVSADTDIPGILEKINTLYQFDVIQSDEDLIFLRDLIMKYGENPGRFLITGIEANDIAIPITTTEKERISEFLEKFSYHQSKIYRIYKDLRDTNEAENDRDFADKKLQRGIEQILFFCRQIHKLILEDNIKELVQYSIPPRLISALRADVLMTVFPSEEEEDAYADVLQKIQDNFEDAAASPQPEPFQSLENQLVFIQKKNSIYKAGPSIVSLLSDLNYKNLKKVVPIKIVYTTKPLHRLVQLSMGLGTNTIAWNIPNFACAILFDEEDAAQGGLFMLKIEDKGEDETVGKQSLVLMHINPSKKLLRKVKASDLYDKIIAYAWTLAHASNMDEVLISADCSILNSELAEVIRNKKYKKRQLYTYYKIGVLTINLQNLEMRDYSFHEVYEVTDPNSTPDPTLNNQNNNNNDNPFALLPMWSRLADLERTDFVRKIPELLTLAETFGIAQMFQELQELFKKSPQLVTVEKAADILSENIQGMIAEPERFIELLKHGLPMPEPVSDTVLEAGAEAFVRLHNVVLQKQESLRVLGRKLGKYGTGQGIKAHAKYNLSVQASRASGVVTHLSAKSMPQLAKRYSALKSEEEWKKLNKTEQNQVVNAVSARWKNVKIRVKGSKPIGMGVDLLLQREEIGLGFSAREGFYVELSGGALLKLSGIHKDQETLRKELEETLEKKISLIQWDVNTLTEIPGLEDALDVMIVRIQSISVRIWESVSGEHLSTNETKQLNQKIGSILKESLSVLRKNAVIIDLRNNNKDIQARLRLAVEEYRVYRAAFPEDQAVLVLVGEEEVIKEFKRQTGISERDLFNVGTEPRDVMPALTGYVVKVVTGKTEGWSETVLLKYLSDAIPLKTWEDLQDESESIREFLIQA